eukprot:191387-Pelagomonas_calceolata.AAC.1
MHSAPEAQQVVGMSAYNKPTCNCAGTQRRPPGQASLHWGPGSWTSAFAPASGCEERMLDGQQGSKRSGGCRPKQVACRRAALALNRLANALIEKQGRLALNRLPDA